MNMVWPDKSGCLTARMTRGFNGQDAMGLLIVTTSPDRQSVYSNRGGGKQFDGTAV